MSRYLYHYCAESQVRGRVEIRSSGLFVSSNKAKEDSDWYPKVLDHVASTIDRSPSSIILLSLSYLGEQPHAQPTTKDTISDE